jgi:hypothetical protein
VGVGFGSNQQEPIGPVTSSVIRPVVLIVELACRLAESAIRDESMWARKYSIYTDNMHLLEKCARMPLL